MGSSIAFTSTTKQLIEQLGLNDFDVMKFHQYEGYKKEDFEINYEELLNEYYNGTSALANRIRSGSTPLSDRTRAEDTEYLQRFVQLKMTIKFLQNTKQFQRYCHYGCWCLPNGASDVGVGSGPPVDDIDRSCREFATCYSCLYNTKIGGACDEENVTRYVIKGQIAEGGRKYLVCDDELNSCKRKRCECDVALAKKLQEYEPQWNIQNHRRLGNPPFNAAQHCKVNSPAPQAYVGNTAGNTHANLDSITFSDFATSSESGGRFTGGFGGVFDQKEPAASPGVGGGMGGGVSKFTQQMAAASLAGGNYAQNQAAEFTVNVVNTPLYGEIIGCCGRSPHVHYFRQGQRCCPDGEIINQNMQCF